MLHHAEFELTDTEELRRLVRDHGWAMLVTATSRGAVVVSHLPVVLDERASELTVLGHLGRPDDRAHELGDVDATLVLQGPHGYVSPSWYGRGGYVPTWNFVVAHLHGRPELLDAAATYDVLERTVDHFEAPRAEPWSLETEHDYAHRIAPGTVGFRLRPTRIMAKAKLSQDKPAEVARRVVRALEVDPVHGNPALAAAMREHHGPA